jgi:hypothetical protein
MTHQLKWLDTHPSPDPEYTRLLADRLKIPELIREYQRRYPPEDYPMDDPRTEIVLAEARSEIERRTANLNRRAVELLQGK